MSRAVGERNLEARDRKADEPAFLERCLKALIAGGDELPGDPAAPDFIDELVGFLGVGLDRTDYPAELAGASGLLLVRVVELRPQGDRLAGGHLGLPRGPGHA